MRILILGAGGIGGYFGGRLLAAGRDVTFLVRPGRAAALAERGLEVVSPKGSLTLPAPTVTAETLQGPYDLILLSCKAYDLASSIEAIAPAVGPGTTILPLLNGMAHLDALDARFGAEAVLGGFCMISVALDGDGRVRHYNAMDGLVFGARTPAQAERADAVAADLLDAGFDGRQSGDVLLEMWEKWVFIAAAAGITCLLRGAVCDILEAEGGRLSLQLLAEAAAIAAAHGYQPRPAAMERARAIFLDTLSDMMASMLRDVERGGPTEGAHILGNLRARAPLGVATPLLDVADIHLKTYEARRARGALPL